MGYVLRAKVEEEFDVNNFSHVDCIMSTIRNGKLDSRHRFIVKPPFTSAITMAMHEMAVAYHKMKESELDTSNTGSVPAAIHQLQLCQVNG